MRVHHRVSDGIEPESLHHGRAHPQDHSSDKHTSARDLEIMLLPQRFVEGHTVSEQVDIVAGQERSRT